MSPSPRGEELPDEESGPRPSSAASGIPPHHSTFTSLDKDGGGGLDVFELHAALLSANTLVPIDNVIRIFNSADKNADGSLSLEEFTDYLSSHEQLEKGSATKKRIAIWKTLLSDWKFWVVSLHTWAGIIYMIMFFCYAWLPTVHFLNLDIAKTLMYLCGTTFYLCNYPRIKWQAQVAKEESIKKFQKSIFGAAKEHYIAKHGEMMEQATIDTATIYRTYVYDVIFVKKDSDKNLAMVKSDLECIMLSQLGCGVSGPLIDEIWSVIDTDLGGTIDPEEFIKFLLTDADPPTTNRQRMRLVLCTMITDRAWIFSTVFLTGGVVSCLANLLPRNGHPITFPYFIQPRTLKHYLLTIGSLYFTFAAYDACSDSYYLQQKAEKMIAIWIKAMNKNDKRSNDMSSTMLQDKFWSNDGGLSKKEFHRLLENSGVYLPTIEFDKIFSAVDESKDGIVTKDEIEEYVTRREGEEYRKGIAILKHCMQDFNFWAATTWVFGGICFIVGAHGVWSLGFSRVSIMIRTFAMIVLFFATELHV